MPRYKVQLHYDVDAEVVIEAATKDEAEDEAMNLDLEDVRSYDGNVRGDCCPEVVSIKVTRKKMKYMKKWYWHRGFNEPRQIKVRKPDIDKHFYEGFLAVDDEFHGVNTEKEYSEGFVDERLCFNTKEECTIGHLEGKMK